MRGEGMTQAAIDAATAEVRREETSRRHRPDLDARQADLAAKVAAAKEALEAGARAGDPKATATLRSLYPDSPVLVEIAREHARRTSFVAVIAERAEKEDP